MQQLLCSLKEINETVDQKFGDKERVNSVLFEILVVVLTIPFVNNVKIHSCKTDTDSDDFNKCI